jgi:hypothetical protein
MLDGNTLRRKWELLRRSPIFRDRNVEDLDSMNRESEEENVQFRTVSLGRCCNIAITLKTQTKG